MLTLADALRGPDPVSPRLPGSGPLIISIPGISGVQVGTSTTGAAVLFRWPRAYLVSGLWLSEDLQVTPVSIAATRLRAQDDQRNELFIDGAGTSVNAPAMALVGRSPRWMPFRRIVRAGQKWLFQITNLSAAVAIRPQLYFRVEDE